MQCFFCLRFWYFQLVHLNSFIPISSLLQRVNACPSELSTYDQFYILSFYVWMVFFLPRGKFVEGPALQDLVQLGLRI